MLLITEKWVVDHFVQAPFAAMGDQKLMKSKIVDKNKYNIVSQI